MAESKQSAKDKLFPADSACAPRPSTPARLKGKFKSEGWQEKSREGRAMVSELRPKGFKVAKVFR
jgi:hypothetical protein